MPGSYIVKPIEANLTHNTDLLTKMDPYCCISVNNTKFSGQPCKKGGKHPHWNDSINLPPTNESKVLVQLMDKDRFTADENIGSFMLNLQEAQALGHVNKWYPLYYKNKDAGEILLEVVYQPEVGVNVDTSQEQLYGKTAGQGQYVEQVSGGTIEQQQQQAALIGGINQPYEQEKYYTTQQEITQQQNVIPTTIAQPAVVHQGFQTADIGKHSHVWTEQRQVVEPHTFMKEVEVVETRPAMKEIEVMEPVKVVKEVQYTQAVPVKKQFETVQPQVVTKEVEIIEPRLVTKTIQVVENVPVKRQVEVVEMRNSLKEVQTFEPQTFTKRVEVTEYVPVKKQVEVTEPITFKKKVEYVEPVITTQTITKESYEPVVIDQKITTEVGPATVVGISTEYGYFEHYDTISLTERQRLAGLQRWVGYETIFTGLNEQERLWEQQRLSRLSEQEWLRERERLLKLKEQNRLREQRSLFSKIHQAFKDSGQKGYTYSSQYHPSPNF